MRLVLAYAATCSRCKRPASPATTETQAMREALYGDKWHKVGKALVCKACWILEAGTGSGARRAAVV